MSRFAAVLAVLVAWSSAARAELDAEVNKPYHLRIAVRVASHRALTPVFKRQLQDELHDSLRAAFGALADVEVLDMGQPEVLANEPLLRQVAARGLQQGLDGPQPLGPSKTHFVFVDFEDNQYVITARQHDGLTGLASPVVRRTQTRDRYLVARSAALLINQDFGLVGTFGGARQDGKVTVRLKAGALGVPLRPWAGKDEVFAIAVLARDSTGVRSERLPGALLRVLAEPEKDTCDCQLYYRSTFDGDPLPRGPNIVGYRCLHLGTITAPLRLRFVAADKSGLPRAGLRVLVSEHGFGDKAREQGATDADGRVQFVTPYSHVAFVRVLNAGGSQVARLPVEILGDRPVVCEVAVSPEGDRVGQLVARRNRLLWRLIETVSQQNVLLKEVGGLKSREEALKKAQAGLDALIADTRALSDDYDKLRQDAGGVEKLDVREGQRGLETLKVCRDTLQTFIKNLQEIIKVENDPRLQEWKTQANNASALEQQAEYKQALELYEKVLREGAQDPELTKYVEKLRQEWQPKSEEHRKAREFIYGPWARAEEITALKDNLPAARKAFEECRAVGDWRTVRKLLKVNFVHTANLIKEQAKLEGTNADDVQKIQTISEVAGGLRDLTEKADKFAKETGGSR
jgi:tetratricopeptide (TPR) repeat protein